MAQLFQFLQATAQEEGIFGESQASGPGSHRLAGGCCPLLGSGGSAPGRRAGGGQSWVLPLLCPWVVPPVSWGFQPSLSLTLTFVFFPECVDPRLAMSAIWTFRDLGVRWTVSRHPIP